MIYDAEKKVNNAIKELEDSLNYLGQMVNADGYVRNAKAYIDAWDRVKMAKEILKSNCLELCKEIEEKQHLNEDK